MCATEKSFLKIRRRLEMIEKNTTWKERIADFLLSTE